MQYYLEQITLDQAKDLILLNNLNLDNDVDYTVGLFYDNKLVATGSLFNNVIKLVVVDKNYQGFNFLSLIMTNLINKLTERNILKYFVFTLKDNVHYFTDMGFSLIQIAYDTAILENNIFTINECLGNLKQSLNLNTTNNSSIVMNCNPITNGHLYLIEKASNESEHVIIFILEEDNQEFTFNERLTLVKKATSHLENISVIGSTNYIISSSIMPSYFLKNVNTKTEIQMELDVLIFQNYFMQIFNINKRYVGNEPLDNYTSKYNEVLKRHLEEKLVVVERAKYHNMVISASLVRRLYHTNNFDEIGKIVPKTTLEFLKNKGSDL